MIFIFHITSILGNGNYLFVERGKGPIKGRRKWAEKSKKAQIKSVYARMHWICMSRACIINFFTPVIYGFRNKLVFVPYKPFQPSLALSLESRSSLV